MTVILASLVLLLWTFSAALWVCLWARSREEPPSPSEVLTGIVAEPVRRNASGYLFEFRFHVLDPARASEWLGTPGHACLMDADGGAVLPSLGSPRVRVPGEGGAPLAWGDTRAILFADPERSLASARRAVFVLGDARIDDLEIVQAAEDSSLQAPIKAPATPSGARNIARA